MISHWGYLLAEGSKNMPSMPCDLNLEPVGTDPAAGLKLAVELSLRGIQRGAPWHPCRTWKRRSTISVTPRSRSRKKA